MKTRIHLPGYTPEQRRTLRHDVRSLLGSHRRRLESVEIRVLDLEPRFRGEGRLCEVTVRFRRGGYLSIIEQELHVGRALLRAAWRVEQRQEFGRGRLASTIQRRFAPS